MKDMAMEKTYPDNFDKITVYACAFDRKIVLTSALVYILLSQPTRVHAVRDAQIDQCLSPVVQVHAISHISGPILRTIGPEDTKYLYSVLVLIFDTYSRLK